MRPVADSRDTSGTTPRKRGAGRSPNAQRVADSTGEPGNGAAADFGAALHPELIAALDGLDRADPKQPEAMLAALQTIASTVDGNAALRTATRLAVIERLDARMSERKAREWAAHAFPPPEAPAGGSDAPGVIPTLLQAVEPWPEPVPLGELLEDFAELYRRHVYWAPVCVPEVLAAWCVHTYAVDCFRKTPYLNLQSPLPECGKSLAVDLLEETVCRGLQIVTVTPSTIFRLIEKYRPTVLLDDAETWLSVKTANPELHAILDAGHDCRKVAWRNEETRNGWEPRPFRTYGAKVIAGVGGLRPASLQSRCIVVTMKRKPASIALPPPGDAVLARCAELRRRSTRWANDNAASLKTEDPRRVSLPGRLTGNREHDLWSPLALLAKLAGGNWPQRLHDAAETLTSRRPRENSIGLQLLRDIADIMTKRGVPDMPTALLRQYLCEGKTADGEPTTWANWNPRERDQGRWISAKKMGDLAQPFGVGPARWKSHSGEVVRGWRLADVTAALAPYGVTDDAGE